MRSADSVTHLLTTTYVSVRRKCKSGLQDSLRLYIGPSDQIVVAAELNTTINIILISQFIVIADMLPVFPCSPTGFPTFEGIGWKLTPSCNFSLIALVLSLLTEIKGNQWRKHSHLSYGGVTLTLSLRSNNNNARTVEFGMNTNRYSILSLIIEIKVRMMTITYSLLIENKDRTISAFYPCWHWITAIALANRT